MRAYAIFIASLACCAGAQAATVDTYYYLSPIELANPPGFGIGGTDDLIVTGIMQFDRSKAPGASLRNLRIFDYPGGVADPPEQVNADVISRWEFSYGGPGTRQAVFDGNGKLVGFSDDFAPQLSSDNGTIESVSLGGHFVGMQESDRTYVPDFVSEQVLTDLGYAPGTKAYKGLRCGSWAPPPFNDCDRFGEDEFASLAWGASHASSKAMLFTDFVEFTRAAEAAVRAGIDNPPVGYGDIPPIPVPAPIALLLGGLAAIVGVARRGA
jgi:hypothetical protein